jgi:hypothetical protein
VPVLAFERVDVQLIAVSVFKGVGEAVVRHAIAVLSPITVYSRNSCAAIPPRRAWRRGFIIQFLLVRVNALLLFPLVVSSMRIL